MIKFVPSSNTGPATKPIGAKPAPSKCTVLSSGAAANTNPAGTKYAEAIEQT